MISKIRKIVTHPAFKRLNGLNQHGLDAIADRETRYTRADHGIAVADIVEMHGGSAEDITYALTHDIAHSAFSHSIDRVLAITGATKVDAKVSYHNRVRNTYLHNVGLAEFRTRGVVPPMFVDDVNPDNIEYTLHAGIVYGDLSAERYHEIIEHISFDKKLGVWVFEDPADAAAFAELSERYTRTKWPANAAREAKFCYDIAHSIGTGRISMNDLFYGTDMDVYHRVICSPEYPQSITLYGRSRARMPYARLANGAIEKIGATASRRTYVSEPKKNDDKANNLFIFAICTIGLILIFIPDMVCLAFAAIFGMGWIFSLVSLFV